MHTLTPSTLSRRLPLVLLALALGTAACKTTVAGGGTGGDDGTGGVGGTPGDGGAGGGIVHGPPSAIAEYQYMTSPPDPGSGGTTVASSSSGGPGVDPNTLFIRIGNYSPTCGGSFPWACSPEPTWQVSIGIPPAMQVPGVYSLADGGGLNPFVSITGSNGGGGSEDCWGGGGSFLDGTLEILSNDGSTIVVRLTNTDPVFTEISADGTYTAPICQWGAD